jgi:membrane-associated protease RseP (regulator of RpoE activity)
MDTRATKTTVLTALFVLWGVLAAPPARALQGAPNEGAWLGVYIQDLSDSLRKHFSTAPAEGGVLVSMVMKGSPAEQAGLRSGDVIVELDGTKLAGAEHLREIVSKTRPDTEVRLHVLRGEEQLDLTARLGSKPPGGISSDSSGEAAPETREIPWSRWFLLDYEGGLGARMADMNGGLGEYIGGTDGTGVLVLEVCEGSPAEKAGLRPGDIVVAANGQSVKDLGDLRHELRRSVEPKAGLEVVRKGEHSKFDIELRSGSECWKEPGRSFFHIRPDAPSFRLQPEQEKKDQSELDEMLRAVPDALSELWHSQAGTEPGSPAADEIQQLRKQTEELRSSLDALRQQVKELQERLAARETPQGQ